MGSRSVWTIEDLQRAVWSAEEREKKRGAAAVRAAAAWEAARDELDSARSRLFQAKRQAEHDANGGAR